MTDQVKPATRADVEAFIAYPFPPNHYVPRLIATIESFVPIVLSVAARHSCYKIEHWEMLKGHARGPMPKQCGACFSCQARRLKEQWNA